MPPDSDINLPQPASVGALSPRPFSIPEDVLRALAKAGAKPGAVGVPSLPPKETALILRTRLESFDTVNTFQRGQTVQWKQGLKNRARPQYGQPAIVVQILDEPILDTSEEAGSAYFRESLDIVLGMLAPEDGGFVLYHYDRRRFEAFVE